MQVPVRNHIYKNGRIQVICIFYDRNEGLSTHEVIFLIYCSLRKSIRRVRKRKNKNDTVSM